MTEPSEKVKSWEEWGFNNVIIPRLIRSFAVSSIAFFASCFILTSCLEFSFFHPVMYLSNTMTLLTSFSKIFVCFLFSTTCGLSIFTSWMLSKCNIDSASFKQDFSHIIFHILTNLFVDLFFALFVTNYVSAMDKDLKILLIYLSAMSSIGVSMEFYMEKNYLLRFPKYVKPKIQQALHDMENVAKTGLISMSRFWAIALISYFVIGHHLITATCQIFADIFLETLDADSTPVIPKMNNFYRIMGFVYVLYASIIFTSFLYARRKLAEIGLNICLCQPVEFDLPAADAHAVTQLYVAKNEAPNLTEAMCCEIYGEYLKYLSFWDFSRFTNLSKPRVRQVFVVSRPGGHPRPWNAVKDECLLQLQYFASKISDLNEKLARNWAATIGRYGKPDNDVILTPKFENQIGAKNSTLNVKTKNDVMNWTMMAEAFKHSQLYAWIIEGLGNIICVALTEDKFGVVQRDLKFVLGLFCELQVDIERYGRLCTTQYIEDKRRRIIESQRHILKLQLANTLRQVNAGYQQHLNDVGLTEVQLKLIRSL